MQYCMSCVNLKLLYMCNSGITAVYYVYTLILHLNVLIMEMLQSSLSTKGYSQEWLYVVWLLSNYILTLFSYNCVYNEVHSGSCPSTYVVKSLSVCKSSILWLNRTLEILLIQTIPRFWAGLLTKCVLMCECLLLVTCEWWNCYHLLFYVNVNFLPCVVNEGSVPYILCEWVIVKLGYVWMKDCCPMLWLNKELLPIAMCK